jgi:hypothetical protein
MAIVFDIKVKIRGFGSGGFQNFILVVTLWGIGSKMGMKRYTKWINGQVCLK